MEEDWEGKKNVEKNILYGFATKICCANNKSHHDIVRNLGPFNPLVKKINLEVEMVLQFFFNLYNGTISLSWWNEYPSESVESQVEV